MKDITRIIAAFEELNNPFEDMGPDLMSLHSQTVMNDEVVNTVKDIVKIGEKHYQSFADERLVEGSKPVSDVIKKNNLLTFNITTKRISKQDAKANCALFSRLYIACQNKDGNLAEFFKYSNQPWPPALSKMGQLGGGGKKVDLVKCL